MTGPKPVLGWKERVTLPDWGFELRAKLDTGARTSALHVRDLRVIGDPNDSAARVQFDVVLGTRRAPEHHPIEAPLLGLRRVRDTGARSEQRPVIRVRIIVGPLDLHTDVTLTDRSGMNFRMLIGRRTLDGHCLVDPSRGYLARR